MTLNLRTKILIAVAVAITAYVLFPGADPDAVTPTGHNTTTRAHKARLPENQPPASASLTAVAHRVTSNSAAGALFATHSWYVPPPPPPAPPKSVLTAAQQAELNKPTAPPLPFAFMGRYFPDGATPVFFLTQGDRVYDVRIGDTIDNTYKVDSYANGQLVMTYKPLNIQQQLAVGGSQ